MSTKLRLATCATRHVAAPPDLHGAARACKALARALARDDIGRTLITLALRHSGADSAMLLLVDGGQRVRVARAWAFGGGIDVCLEVDTPSARQAPLALFDAVDALRASVVLANGAALPCGAIDAYVRARAPASALGVPLLHNDAPLGMLYLEHISARALFSPARVDLLDLLDLLATHAALALAHAQLVGHMRAEGELRRRAETALRQARGELARAARVTTMGQFAASIAHEVSQPLAAVALHAGAAINWLRQEPAQLARAHHALEMVMRSATRAGDMVRGIRALARKSGPELTSFEVDAAVRETLLLMRAELQALGVIVVADLALGQRQLRADRAQLQQVIMNLVLNAIDAMADVAARQRRLTVRSGQDGGAGGAGGALRISVTDNGCGIDADAAARVFEALFSTKPGGMGMGLSISRAIIEAHGGQLWCEANAAHGCTFHLSLPADAADANTAANADQAAPA